MDNSSDCVFSESGHDSASELEGELTGIVMKDLWKILLVILVVTAVVVIVLVKQYENPDAVDEPGTEPVAETLLPTMLELGSEGCHACEQMKPVMAHFEENHSDLVFIQFHDVRQQPAIAQQYGIRLIPTQVFLTAEGNEFFRHEGYFAIEEVENVFREMGVEI